MTAKKSATFVLIAFLGSFFSAVSGVGPGVIFNSVLIQYDMHPGVASATGMYLTMFTALSATINILINEGLDIPYSILICVLTLVGSIPGLFGQGWLVKVTGGRNQFTVMILLFFLLFILVTVLPLSIISTIRASDAGDDVTSFNSFCN